MRMCRASEKLRWQNALHRSLSAASGEYSLPRIQPVCNAGDIEEIKKKVTEVTVKENVLGYIEDMIELTRNEKRFVIGASPRAMLSLVRAAQAKAFLSGRNFKEPDR